MILDLFDWIKSNKHHVKKAEKTDSKQDQPDLFRVDSDDISDVKPRTEILQAIRRTNRKSPVRKLK